LRAGRLFTIDESEKVEIGTASSRGCANFRNSAQRRSRIHETVRPDEILKIQNLYGGGKSPGSRRRAEFPGRCIRTARPGEHEIKRNAETGLLTKPPPLDMFGKPRSPRRGYLYAILAASLWGSSGPAAKFLFAGGITPFQMVQLRVTLCTAMLFLWLILRRPALLRISLKDIPYFLVLGTLGMSLLNITYLYAISRINVAAAILLEYMATVFIALHAVVIARDRLSPLTLLAIACALGGCFLAVGAYNLNLLSMNMAGILSGLGSALSFGWWSVHGEYGMRRYNPWTVLFYAMLCAAAEWNMIHPPLEAFQHAYSPVQWFWLCYIGLAGALLPYGFYLQGINLIRSTRAAITATLEPIIAGIVAFVFLNEVMQPLQLLGGALVISAIVLLQTRQEHDAKAPELIRARKSSA